MRTLKPQNYLLCLLFLFLFIQSSYGQHKAYFIGEGEPRLQKLVAQAQAAFDSSDYYNAYKFYGAAVQIEKNNADNQFKLAESAREYGAYCIARDAYGRVLQLDTLHTFPTAPYRFAEMTKMEGKYEKADSILSKLNYEGDSEEIFGLETLIEKDLDDIEYANEALNNAVSTGHKWRKLEGINTKHAEYNPVWRNGQLYYGSMAFTKSEDVVEPSRKFTKTLRYDMDLPAEEWSAFNISDKSTTHLSFTPDDSRVYFTICDYKNKRSEVRCHIYYKDKIDGTTDEWGEAIALPKSINQTKYTSTHPSYGLNEMGEPVLYYVSDRGRKNDLDIWFTKIHTDGSFSAPKQLGEGINTTYNEITPFYHFPSHTLYFSSNGHKGFGGYDINKWTLGRGENPVVKNTGTPFNSSGHDFNYFLKKDGEKGFFVSSREGCDTLIEEVGCHDIYEIDICNTNAVICVFEEVTSFGKTTNIPLLNASLNLQNGVMELRPTAVEQHCFSYNELPAISSFIASATHEGYESIDTVFNLVICQENIYEIYLRKPPCDPLLTVNVFGQTLNTSFPLDKNTILLKPQVPYGRTVVEESIFTNLSNSATFSVDSIDAYDVVVSREEYLPKTIRVSNIGCIDTIKVVLIPKEIKLDSSIVCYFDHDIPARIRVGGKVDPAQVRIGEFSYATYYQRYTSMNRQGVYENTFPDRTAVQGFFQEDVIANNERLIKFRDAVYQNLVQDKNVSYEITIKGFCSYVGNVDYNKKLAYRRVDAVYKFLLEKLRDSNIESSRIKFIHTPVGEEPELFYATQKVMNGKFNPESCRQRRAEVIGIKRVDISSSMTSSFEE